MGEHLREERRGLRLVDRREPVGVLDDGDPHPEAGEHLREFAPDRAAAEDHQGRRGSVTRTASRLVQYGVSASPPRAAPPAASRG